MLGKCNDSTRNEEDHDFSAATTPRNFATTCRDTSKHGVYFILEKASLVPAYVGKKYQILNPDEHADFLRKKNMNPYDFRPDIVHEALRLIMISWLRMAGRLRVVFIRTDEGILIRVEPQTQIPITLQSFCNMMAELLQKFSIKSKDGHRKLLKLIQNPVTNHLPVNSRKIGLSFSSAKAVQLRYYVSDANCNENLVFVVGAMAHEKIDVDEIDDFISGCNCLRFNVTNSPPNIHCAGWDLLFSKSCIVRFILLREAVMLNPFAKSMFKRKRAEKQSPNLTIGKDLDKDVKKKEITPFASSPENVKSPATFFLYQASLRMGLVGKKWKILNLDEDAQFRPHIMHEAIRCILNSPLNKIGMVRVISVRNDQGEVFTVKPHDRIPRTCRRFCGVIMEWLIKKNSARAKDTNEFHRVIEEPKTRHLPVNSHKVGVSYTLEKFGDEDKVFSGWKNDSTPVFVVDAIVNGKVKGDYIHDYISVSEYPLNVHYRLGMICDGLELKWKIF